MIRVVALLVLAALLRPSALPAMPDARSSWQIVRAGRLIVYSELSSKETGRIVDRLRDFRADVFAEGRALTVSDPGDTTRIFLFRTAAGMREYEILGWDALFHQGGETSYLLLHQERWENSVSSALTMECMGSLGNAYPQCPAWVARGLGEFYSSYHRASGDVVVGDELKEERRLLRESTLIPWERVCVSEGNVPEVNDPRVSLFDAQAWLLVHYLIVGARLGESAMATFLTDLENGSDYGEAFRSSFGFAPSEVGSRLDEYENRGTLSPLHFPAPPVPEETDAEVQPASLPVLLDALAEMVTALSVGAGDPDLARRRRTVAQQHLDEVREIAPDLPALERGLGVLALAGGDSEQAATHLRRAIAADSTDLRARFLLGSALVGRYRNRSVSFARVGVKRQMPADLAEAREQLLAVLRERQDLVEAHVLLGETFLEDPGDSAPGLSTLRSILAMFPGRSDVRQDVVFLALKRGDFAPAFDTALGGRFDDLNTRRNLGIVVDVLLDDMERALPENAARAGELAQLLLQRLGRDTLSEGEQRRLSDLESRLKDSTLH
ncbi:MAG: hypothetical protein U0167_18585 [bacterium]